MTTPLSAETIAIVKATAPVLQEHGLRSRNACMRDCS